MAWIRARLEVPAITGDGSVLLVAPPPDGGWTPRLDRTVTPDRATKSQGNLFFSGGIMGGRIPFGNPVNNPLTYLLQEFSIF